MKGKIAVAVVLVLVVMGGLAGPKVMQFRKLIASNKEMVQAPEVVSATVAHEEKWQGTLSAIGTVTAVQGVNVTTGDYSRGAAGLWIRNGELAFAVSEVTIAGNLAEMLMGLEAIGSDLEFRGSMVAPTLKIGEMTVGGK